MSDTAMRLADVPSEFEDEAEGVTVDTTEVFEYLDALRESGVTNMYGATPFVQEEFGVSRRAGHKLLGWWMQTFVERHPRT